MRTRSSALWLLPPLFVSVLLPTTFAAGQETARYEGPILDMHMHALAADAMGPPPLAICAPFEQWPTWDQRQPYGAQFMTVSKDPTCANPVWSAETDEALMRRTIEVMERRNVIGVLSGPREIVARWIEAAPERFIPGLGFSMATNTPFGDRVMWGSDQMVWPGVIEHSIEAIEEADYLTEEQKRAILYDNAARFLRLGEEEIARHHAR